MKKYPVKFIDDYLMFEEWSKKEDDEFMSSYWKEHIKNNQDKLEMCKKWVGKEITLSELEEVVSEFNEVLFDGKSITVVNGHLD
jgi:benzoyl-CoA reductase/2-hydroxyglutaryl-CoA dehydratase subunit BcrC/BadD/HgdB